MKEVPRPSRKLPYKIFFASNKAEKGWESLKANRLNDLADAWEYLSNKPLHRSDYAYPLKGKLGKISRAGIEYDRWQLKLSHRDGSRIWYWVEDGNVFIEQVHTSHPNETK
jgi:hypothetical protein